MVVGGSGWDMMVNLPPEVEAEHPGPEEYALYKCPTCDGSGRHPNKPEKPCKECLGSGRYPHSIGFAMRGCQFNCAFCAVRVMAIIDQRKDVHGWTESAPNFRPIIRDLERAGLAEFRRQGGRDFVRLKTSDFEREK